MEFKITTQTKGFEPIKVEINLQSRNELIELAMRLNVSILHVNNYGYLGHSDKREQIDSPQFEKLFWDLHKIHEDLNK